MNEKGKSARKQTAGTGQVREKRKRAIGKPAAPAAPGSTPDHQPAGTSDLLRIQRDLALELLSTHDLQACLRVLLASAMRLPDFDSGGIYLADEATGDLHLIAHRGLSDAFVRAVSHYPPDSTQAHMVRTGQLVCMVRSELEVLQNPVITAEGLQTLVVVPVRHLGRSIGAINLSSHHLPCVEPATRVALESLTAQAEIAIVVVRAREELECRVAERTAELQQANAAMREQALHLDWALDASQAGTWRWDCANPQIECDHRACALLGFGNSEPVSFRDFVLRIHPEDRQLIYQGLERELKPGERYEWNHEYRINHTRLGWRWISDMGRMWRDAIDGRLRMAGINFDITARKSAELAARESSERYHLLRESMMDAHGGVDNHGRFREFNQHLLGMLGYTAEELTKLDYHQLTPPQWHAFEQRIVDEQIMARGYSDVYEKEYRRKDGTIIPVELRAYLTRDPDGRPDGMWAIVRDISERKRAQEAIRKSEEKYRTLYESMADAFVLQDLSNKVLECNRAFGEMLGYSREELLRMTINDLTPPQWIDTDYRIAREQVFPRGYSDTWEKEYRRKDGTIIPVELRSFLVRNQAGDPVGAWAIVRDITPRKQAELALRQSEEKYRALYESIADACVTLDMSCKFIECNPAFEEMVGYSCAELLEMTVYDVTPSEWHELGYRLAAEQTLQRGYSDPYEKEYRRKDGTIIPVEARAFLIRDQAGNPTGIWSMIRDITERKKVEQTMRDWNGTLEQRVAERTLELAQSEARFRQLAEATFEGIGISRDGIILDCNSQYAAMFGYQADEIKGLSLTDLVPPDFRPKTAHRIRNDIGTPFEFDGLRKDGSTFQAEVCSRITTWEGTKARVSVVRDLTEQKEAAARLARQQAELDQANRLALVSEISAGIIHQIGQPLCSMGANLAVILATPGEFTDPRSLAMLRELDADVARMRDAVVHLRALANPEQPARAPCQLNEVLAEPVEQLQREAPHRGCQLQVNLAPDLPPVLADPVQFRQVILNLARNAFDAVANSPAKRRVVTVTTRRLADDQVELCVCDTGPGIPPAVVSKLFTPFFSTKENGLGIGLRLSQTIVHAHGGTLRASNNPDGIGANFCVTLPAATV